MDLAHARSSFDVRSGPYLNDVFTIPSNLAGIPALSVPVCLDVSNGLPIGLQLLGDYHAESRILDVAEWMTRRVKLDGVQFEPFKDEALLQKLHESKRK
jgi:Asp-tRNA(Asn)/Glu-tRNA(Gln) amidotransferase A subunit family amidase